MEPSAPTMLSVAAGQLTETDLAAWIDEHSSAVGSPSSQMKSI